MSLTPVVRIRLRPGFALVAAPDHRCVCDPLGRIRAVRREALPAGLCDPRAIDPVERRDFLAGLGAAGIATMPGGVEGWTDGLADPVTRRTDRPSAVDWSARRDANQRTMEATSKPSANGAGLNLPLSRQFRVDRC